MVVPLLLAVCLIALPFAVDAARAQTAPPFPSTSSLTLDTSIHPFGPGVSGPQLVKRVVPVSTPAARAAKATGWIGLMVVVLPDGRVGEAKIVETCVGTVSAHREANGDPFQCGKSAQPVFGLEDPTLAAVRQWMFRPGRKDGKPVAVRMLTRIDFHVGEPVQKPIP
jgi:hypothetical protein